MTEIIIKALCIVLAACCKAVSDSICPRKGRIAHLGGFWDINKRGKELPFTTYPLDGWHVFNSLMIFAFIGAGCLEGYKWWIDIPVLGVVFITTFNIMYNKILK